MCMPMPKYINANVYMLEEEVTFEGLRASFQSAVCFDEESAKFLWPLVVPKRRWLTDDISLPEDPYLDWPKCGISRSCSRS